MKTKTILFLFLLFAGVLFFSGSYYAQAQCIGVADGTSCTADGGVAGECYGEICIRCGQAGDACESTVNCCSGLNCVSMQCVTDDDEISGEEKCSGDFEEIAGVCFPTGTGLAETPIADILSNALFWLLGIFGFFGIAGFVISGIQYLVSAGNEKGIETAKRNMKWSLVGVVVGISGMVIIRAITAALEATTSSF